MDAVFKALADPSRRKLLDELRKQNGQTLSELCEHLDMTRQAITKHLVLLEKANLIAVVLFLLWIYYTAYVFLLGGEVAETYDLMRMRRQQRVRLG